MDISLGQGVESHGRLSFHASPGALDGKLKGKPIDRIFPHWLLPSVGLWFFLKLASSYSVPILPSISCGELTEKLLKGCCGPPKSILSELLLASSPSKSGERLNNMDATSAVHLVCPDISGVENMNPLGKSPCEMARGVSLQMVGLIDLYKGMSTEEKLAAEASCSSLLLHNWMIDPDSLVQEMFSGLKWLECVAWVSISVAVFSGNGDIQE